LIGEEKLMLGFFQVLSYNSLTTSLERTVTFACKSFNGDNSRTGCPIDPNFVSPKFCDQYASFGIHESNTTPSEKLGDGTTILGGILIFGSKIFHTS
jgi:hypothetical protein